MMNSTKLVSAHSRKASPWGGAALPFLAVWFGFWLLSLVMGYGKEITLLNVSYDPTRELYQEFNAAFARHWLGEDRRQGDDQAIARRLGQAGAGGD